jgi:hypothetical protein
MPSATRSFVERRFTELAALRGYNVAWNLALSLTRISCRKEGT